MTGRADVQDGHVMSQRQQLEFHAASPGTATETALMVSPTIKPAFSNAFIMERGVLLLTMIQGACHLAEEKQFLVDSPDWDSRSWLLGGSLSHLWLISTTVIAWCDLAHAS